ncbi:MAG: hypothetical protein H6797_01650 [Candidatus Nomurabacteria bacterium]|nr:MAG: hypothetical protein H6797_01650 [Candidatus Nomurabacteria bacterium]
MVSKQEQHQSVSPKGRMPTWTGLLIVGLIIAAVVIGSYCVSKYGSPATTPDTSCDSFGMCSGYLWSQSVG